MNNKRSSRTSKSEGSPSPSDITSNEEFAREFLRPLSHRKALGRFEIREVIGEGSFGIVYRAFDSVLRREVALKSPKQHERWNKSTRTRFFEEAKLAADLNHHAIIRVFDCGEDGAGNPYISMELCPGKNLAQWLGDNPQLTVRSAAKVVALMADAVHHAHEKGVTHCDLKPQNTLLEPRTRMGIPSEVAVELGHDAWFVPRICDFGLGQFAEDSSMSARGSKAYMAAEQWSGTLTPSIDIFSLGVILCQLLTGRLPFTALEKDKAVDERKEVSGRISPLLREKRVPQDLRAICLKCLAFDATSRYLTASELKSDLLRFLNDETVSVRKPRLTQSLARFVKRNRIAAMVLGTVILGLVSTAWQWWRLRSEKYHHVTVLGSQLLSVEPEGVSPIIRELQEYASRDSRVKKEVLKSFLSSDEPSQLRYRHELARVIVDSSMDPVPVLTKEITGAASLGPKELSAVRDMVKNVALSSDQKNSIAQSLWSYLDSAPPDSDEWLVVAAFLGELDPMNERWSELFDSKIVDALVTQDLTLVDPWTEAFRTRSSQFERKLKEISTRQERSSQESTFATAMLVNYAETSSQVDWFELFLTVDGDRISRFENLLLKSDKRELIHRIKAEVPSKMPSATDIDDRTEIRMANALASLLLIGGEVQTNFFRHSESLSVRSLLVDRLNVLHVSPDSVLDNLESEKDPHAIYAWVIALGGYNEAQLSQKLHERAMSILSAKYEEFDHAGVHCAVRWLLTTWNEAVPKIERSRQDAIDQLNGEKSSKYSVTWFKTSVGSELVAIKGNVQILNGEKRADEYVFAISSTETTRREFEQFLTDNQALRNVFQERQKRANVADEGPDAAQGFVNWDDAARFCNWLSQREGMGLCYSQRDDGRMVAVNDHLRQTGYRLPTFREWQSACGTWTKTARFFGNSESLFPKYAWCAVNVRDGAPQRVAMLRPNPFGLFDVYGNVTEWCDDGENSETRYIRGGAAGDWPVRITTRRNDANIAHTTQPQLVSGFRIACTLVPPQEEDKK